MSQPPPPGPPGPPPPFRPGSVPGWPPPRRRRGPLVALILGVVVVLAAAAVAVVVGVRHHGDHPSAGPETVHSPRASVSTPAGMPSLPPVPSAVAMPSEASEAMNLAEKFIVALDSYGPEDRRGGKLTSYENRVRPLLTPSGRKDFEKNLPYVADAVKQSRAARSAKALGAGVEHLSDSEVRVLVGARVTTTYRGKSPSTSTSYLEVTTTRQPGGTLLVGGIQTASAVPPTGTPAPTGLAPAADQAVLAASKAAPLVLGYDYRTISNWRSRVAPVVTPGYLAQYAKTMGPLVSSARTEKAVVKVEPLALSVGTLSTDRVEVVAYLERPTTTAKATKPIDYRDGVALTMVRTNGEWLIDGVRSLDR